MNPMTQRQTIEAAYYDKWAEQIDVDSVLIEASFSAPTAVENRFILKNFGDLSGKRILDTGCGAGESAVFFALRGARVTAIDISEGQIGVARELAKRNGVDIEFHRLPLENIGSLNRSFDLIYGNGVLHHVDLIKSAAVIGKVLASDGKAAFIEPLSHNPVIWIYRKMAESVRTPTEKPLSMKDIKKLERLFEHIRHEEFWFLSTFVFAIFLIKGMSPSKVRYWKQLIIGADEIESIHRFLFRIDCWLLKKAPWIRRYCWNTVILIEGGHYNGY